MPRISKLLVFDTIFLFDQGFEDIQKGPLCQNLCGFAFSILKISIMRGLLLTLDHDPTRLVRAFFRVFCAETDLTARHRKGTRRIADKPDRKMIQMFGVALTPITTQQ